MLQASLRVFLNVAFSAPALLSDCQPLRKLYSIAPKIKCLWRSFGSSGPAHTDIHLQAQAALTKVCFAASGPNSPYCWPADVTIVISAATT
jgi:hypothetical protein